MFLCLVFLKLLRLFFLPCGHLLGKGWPLGFVGDVYCIFYFPMWYHCSGVALDCIVSLSLPPFLLCELRSLSGAKQN